MSNILRYSWKYFWNIFERHLKIFMNIFVRKFHLWKPNNFIHEIIHSFSKSWPCKEQNAHARTISTLSPHLVLSRDVKPWRHLMIHNARVHRLLHQPALHIALWCEKLKPLKIHSKCGNRQNMNIFPGTLKVMKLYYYTVYIAYIYDVRSNWCYCAVCVCVVCVCTHMLSYVHDTKF